MWHFRTLNRDTNFCVVEQKKNFARPKIDVRGRITHNNHHQHTPRRVQENTNSDSQFLFMSRTRNSWSSQDNQRFFVLRKMYNFDSMCSKFHVQRARRAKPHHAQQSTPAHTKTCARKHEFVPDVQNCTCIALDGNPWVINTLFHSN